MAKRRGKARKAGEGTRPTWYYYLECLIVRAASPRPCWRRSLVFHSHIIRSELYSEHTINVRRQEETHLVMIFVHRLQDP